MTNREAHEEAAGMGLDPLFFTHNGIDPDGDAFKSCDNCNKVYEREYSNGGKHYNQWRRVDAGLAPDSFI